MSSLEVRGTPENNLSSLEVRYASLRQGILSLRSAILYASEVALTCQKSRYLDARMRRIVRGMTIYRIDAKRCIEITTSRRWRSS